MSRWKKKVKHIVSKIVYGCLLAALPTPKKKEPQDEKIAVVCLAALGDFITYCSVARELHRQGKQLTLICRKNIGIEEFASQTNYFDTIIALPHQWRNRIKNIHRLHQVCTNTVMVAPVERHILSDIYALAISANAYFLPDTEEGCSLPFLKRQVDKRVGCLVPITAQNEQERYAQYLRGCGFYSGSVLPFIFDWAVNRKTPERFFFGIFPGAGGSGAKLWPVERFAWVAEQLWGKAGCKILIFGTASEKPLGNHLCMLLKDKAINLCGQTKLDDLIIHLRDCSIVLANDSGGAHLSIACGVPTVVVCGCWEYGRFYPNPYLSPNCRAVIASPQSRPCIPCSESQPSCVRFGAAPCVLSVTKEDVLIAARDCLQSGK